MGRTGGDVTQTRETEIETEKRSISQEKAKVVNKQTSAPGAGVTSNRLKDQREQILSLWEERCLKEVLSAETVNSLSLRNSLPIYLDNLSEALATNRRFDYKTVSMHDDKAVVIGKLHGSDRASGKNYNLNEVIFEYHILREVIFQVLEANEPMVVVQRDIILDSIEQAVNSAAVEFSDTHADIRQKFVNTLTHDLKNPITAAKMNAQMIAKRSDIPVACAGMASKIIGSMNRLEAMIQDLLDASSLRAGEQMYLQFIQCDLHEVVHRVVEQMSATYGDRFLFDSKVAVDGIWGCD
jgi:signal transduction histidine kinase